MEPIATLEPRDTAGSAVLPRWLSYLLLIFLGISGMAGLALIGSYLGSRRSEGPVSAAAPFSPDPVRERRIRLLRPGTPEPTIEQQILIDRIAGFEPRTMHVEQLGRNLLRLEQVARVEARDGSVRLGHLLALDAVPSAPVPAPAMAWARAHGFRVLAVDGSGMALVMPDLSTGGRSVLGVLPIGAMVEGASRVPMSVQLAESERDTRSRPAPAAGASVL
jgi:hypothetical protein